MKTNDEILEQLTSCTIEEDADLDVKENFYYKYEDVIKAMNKARKQANVKQSDSFSNWTKHLVIKMKKYPLVKNKWKKSRFKRMYKDGLSVSEAFRCWFCSH